MIVYLFVKQNKTKLNLMPSMIFFTKNVTERKKMLVFYFITFSTDLTMASAKLCPNCNKQEGIVPCVGCNQIFCVKHFQIHRQNLAVELENIVTRRNTLQDYYQNTVVPTFHPNKFPIWNDIDEWEQQMKEQIRRTADEARKQLDVYSQQSQKQIEHQLNQMTEVIQQKMERENFVEEDISKLTHQIDQLEQGFQNQTYHPQIEILTSPIDWNTSLQVKLSSEEKQPEPTIPMVTHEESIAAVSVTSKPKYPPSIQRKCFTCGTDTWQKECKCCAHTYCGWHLKRHTMETKKH